MLALAGGVEYVHEPDNERVSLIGKWFKTDVPRFPYLRPGDDAPRYRRLWEYAARSRCAMLLSRSQLTRVCKAVHPWRDAAVRARERRLLAGFEHRPAPPGPTIEIDRRHPRIIKTVHAVLCAEWITSVIPVDRVIVTRRHPLAILASWRRLCLPDATRDYTLSDRLVEAVLGRTVRVSSELGRQALHLAVLQCGLQSQVKRHADWIVVKHEELCKEPSAGFLELYRRVGLTFTPRVEAGIAARNRAGTGFTPRRVAADEIDKWKNDYSPAELEEATNVLTTAGLWP